MLRTKLMWFWLVVLAMGAKAVRAQEPPQETQAIAAVVAPFADAKKPDDAAAKLQEQKRKDLEKRWEDATCSDCARLKGETLLRKVSELEEILKAAQEQGHGDIAGQARVKVDSLQEAAFLARIEVLKAQAKAAGSSGDVQFVIEELDVLRGMASSIKAPAAKSRYSSTKKVDYETRVLKAQREVFESWASKFGKEDAATIAETLKTWSESASGSREAAATRVLPIMTRLAGKTSLDSAQEVAETVIDYASSLEGAEADRAAGAVFGIEQRFVEAAKTKGELEHLDTAREILENMEGMDLSASKERQVQRELRTGLDLAKLEALASQPNGPMSFEFQAQHAELKQRLQREALSSCNWASQKARCQEAQAAYQEFNAKDIMAQAAAYEMLKNPTGRGDGVNGLQPWNLQGAQPQAGQQPGAPQNGAPQQPNGQQPPQFQANPLQPFTASPMMGPGAMAWNNGMNGFRPNQPPMQFAPGNLPMNMPR